MNKIQVKILNPNVVAESEKMMVAAARLTQHGDTINNVDDFMKMYKKPYSSKLVETFVNLPHPTIQKFGVINIVIVGASRRFLAQITRHQNEVKFMSASLQYSDYSENNNFVVPYEILKQGQNVINDYLDVCKFSMTTYKNAIERKICGNDSAGYMAPQSLRNVLIMSATPYQWKHIISQRTCNRNTPETQYVMLKIWSELYKLNPILFGKTAGPFCICNGVCKEGKMSCGKPLTFKRPDDLIRELYPLCEVKDE